MPDLDNSIIPIQIIEEFQSTFVSDGVEWCVRTHVGDIVSIPVLQAIIFIFSGWARDARDVPSEQLVQTGQRIPGHRLIDQPAVDAEVIVVLAQ